MNARHPFVALAAALALMALASAAPTATARGEPNEPAPGKILVMIKLPAAHVRPNADYGGAYGDGMGHDALRREAGRLARKHGLGLADDWPMPLVGVDCFVMTLPAGVSPKSAAAILDTEPGVAWSEPMNLYRAQANDHNDPLYAFQPAAREWGLAELHRSATGAQVRVAVIDSRVEARHPDLIGQVELERDFTSEGGAGPEFHGTGVAGLIAARADNGLGIAGVAPGARLLALRACHQLPTSGGRTPETVCDSLSLAKALDFAITHSAEVINLSLAGAPDQLLGRLIDIAVLRRIVVVGAYDRSLPGGGFPASHSGVVAVADEGWGRPPRGVYVAPGRDVPTTTPGGHWSIVNGSSFAAAQVSGLIALARERRPGAVRLAAYEGRIDACATLQLAGRSIDCDRLRLSQTATFRDR